MATPYFQVRLDSVASTQDEARGRVVELPVAVIARAQTAGRGRSGAAWINADRAVAVSVAARVGESDRRPFSLMAGVAAARVMPGVALKWPNDVMLEGSKVGGILVERSGGILVVGLGVNLWWPDPPDGMGAIDAADPGPDRPAVLGALWVAEMMSLIDGEGWPRDEYLSRSDTIGRLLGWEPDGSGQAVDVAADGGLVVTRDGGARETIYSGEVRYLRSL